MPSQNLLRPVGGVVTNPYYLVELQFAPILYLSSGPDITWDGHDWKAAPVRVSSIDMDMLGQQDLSLSIANHDRTFGAFLLQEKAQERVVRVWLTYDDPGFKPMLLADGFMDGAAVGEFVQIKVISRSTAYGTTPRIICSPPLFNHLPAPGSTLTAGSTTITIEDR